MIYRVRMQLAEALGSENRWYCSQFYGREVHDAETLLDYFVRSGGAADFGRRWGEAMGKVNRWYCSEYYRRDVREEDVLWGYYRWRGEGRMASRGGTVREEIGLWSNSLAGCGQ